MWKPFTYQSPEEVSVILLYRKAQAVLFAGSHVTDKQPKAILQSEENKYPVRKEGHTDVFFLFITVGWGSYFDHAVTWNKHIEDENIMIITYEDLKEVKQMLCTDRQNTSEQGKTNLLK